MMGCAISLVKGFSINSCMPAARPSVLFSSVWCTLSATIGTAELPRSFSSFRSSFVTDLAMIFRTVRNEVNLAYGAKGVPCPENTIKNLN
jgi:hypothetical protein